MVFPQWRFHYRSLQGSPWFVILGVCWWVIQLYYFIFCSDDLEKYNQLQYTLISDDEEQLSIKDIQVLLVQALVYRLMVFAFEVHVMICLNVKLWFSYGLSKLELFSALPSGVEIGTSDVIPRNCNQSQFWQSFTCRFQPCTHFILMEEKKTLKGGQTRGVM